MYTIWFTSRGSLQFGTKSFLNLFYGPFLVFCMFIFSYCIMKIKYCTQHFRTLCVIIYVSIADNSQRYNWFRHVLLYMSANMYDAYSQNNEWVVITPPQFRVCWFYFGNEVFVILYYRASRCWQGIFLGTVGIYGAQWLFTYSVCTFLWVLEACLWLRRYCVNLFLIHKLQWVHLISIINSFICSTFWLLGGRRQKKMTENAL